MSDQSLAAAHPGHTEGWRDALIEGAAEPGRRAQLFQGDPEAQRFYRDAYSAAYEQGSEAARRLVEQRDASTGRDGPVHDDPER